MIHRVGIGHDRIKGKWRTSWNGDIRGGKNPRITVDGSARGQCGATRPCGNQVQHLPDIGGVKESVGGGIQILRVFAAFANTGVAHDGDAAADFVVGRGVPLRFVAARGTARIERMPRVHLMANLMRHHFKRVAGFRVAPQRRVTLSFERGIAKSLKLPKTATGLGEENVAKVVIGGADSLIQQLLIDSQRAILIRILKRRAGISKNSETDQPEAHVQIAFVDRIYTVDDRGDRGSDGTLCIPGSRRVFRRGRDRQPIGLQLCERSGDGLLADALNAGHPGGQAAKLRCCRHTALSVRAAGHETAGVNRSAGCGGVARCIEQRVYRNNSFAREYQAMEAGGSEVETPGKGGIVEAHAGIGLDIGVLRGQFRGQNR